MTRKKKIARLMLIAAAALFILPAALELVQSMPGSAAWERTSDDSFDRIYGSDPFSFWLCFSSHQAKGGTITRTQTHASQPMRLGSLTIIDLSATPLSRKIAHQLASDARQLEGLTAVDVRTFGDDVERNLIGDQLLVLEEIDSNASSWLPVSGQRAHVRARMGHVPEYGWGDDRATIQALQAEWSVKHSGFYLGTPGGAVGKLAKSIAAKIDLAKTWAEMADGEGPILREQVNSSGVLAPDLGTSSEIRAAMKLKTPAILQGRRHGRVGEAHWRYEAPDAVDRLEAAVSQLKVSGWKIGNESSGVDGRVHMSRLSRGNEAVRFSYEENRETMLQRIYYSRSRIDGPMERHIEGPASDPVVWIHYFHGGESSNEPPAPGATPSASNAG